MLDYATMTDEQYEAYVNDMYVTEEDYLSKRLKVLDMINVLDMLIESFTKSTKPEPTTDTLSF